VDRSWAPRVDASDLARKKLGWFERAASQRRLGGSEHQNAADTYRLSENQHFAQGHRGTRVAWKFLTHSLQPLLRTPERDPP